MHVVLRLYKFLQMTNQSFPPLVILLFPVDEELYTHDDEFIIKSFNF